MTFYEKIQKLWEHVFWADARLVEALKNSNDSAPGAHREFAHIIGTEETWLARIEQRSPSASVWPEISISDLLLLVNKTHSAYRAYLSSVREIELESTVTYSNSTGQQFTNSIGDILLHVALHGQYHRGKVNLILRQSGHLPVPTDYIAFIRGTPAATKNA